jgi:hypothetical protein
VDLEGEHIDDLSRLGQPRVLRSLSVAYCQISSIARLKPLPQLTTFIADGSQISSFINFFAISNIRKLSLIRTAVAKAPTFVLSALLVCPQLTNLNGKQVPALQIQRAARYPALGKALVNAGWFADFPSPHEDRLGELSVQYRIELPADDNEPPPLDDEPAEEVDTFEQDLQQLWKEHEAIVERARERCERGRAPDDGGQEQATESEPKTELAPEEEEEEEEAAGPPSLVARLAEVLKDNEIEVDEGNLYSSVLRAVDGLCSEAKAKRTAVGDQDD